MSLALLLQMAATNSGVPASPDSMYYLPPFGNDVPEVNFTCKLINSDGLLIGATVRTAHFLPSENIHNFKNFEIHVQSQAGPDIGGTWKGRLLSAQNFDGGVFEYFITPLNRGSGNVNDEFDARINMTKHSVASIDIARYEPVDTIASPDGKTRLRMRHVYYASGYCTSGNGGK